MSGNGKRPALGQKSEARESATSADDKVPATNVCDCILDNLSGFSYATRGDRNATRKVDNMKLHQIIKQFLTTNNESARAAAKACGVPLSTFNSYLKPKKQIDPAHVIAIAQHFGVTVDFLLTGKKPSSDTFKNHPTKKIFSKWVKVTIEDIDESELVQSVVENGEVE